MTLLSKNAEDRYQSAFGVKADLEKCLAKYEVDQHIREFRLATQDFSGKLLLQGKLYGREKETAYLNSLFNNSINGKKTTLFFIGIFG